MVIDDEAPVRNLLSEFFKKKGYEVSGAETAEEAIRLVAETSPDLVILDILLPDVDGIEVLSQLKKSKPELPIIIMTGIGFDESLLREAQEKGASGYISKTLPLDQLLMEVHRHLRFKR